MREDRIQKDIARLAKERQSGERRSGHAAGTLFAAFNKKNCKQYLFTLFA